MSDPAHFGAYCPTGLTAFARNCAQRLGITTPEKWLRSLLFRLAGGKKRKPRDVTVFESQRARLHPYDNICEKRVYAGSTHWDTKERARLAEAIAEHEEDLFYFLDIGANAGLYSLFARATALKSQKSILIACVEPDVSMRARLQFNIASSDAERDILIFPYAAMNARGPVRFSANTKNRGTSCIDENGSTTVEGVPLAEIIKEANFPRVDAMKIDIEGAEFPVLKTFFHETSQTLWPKLAILEVAHDREDHPTLRLFLERGYSITEKSKLNVVLVLNSAHPG